MSRIFICYRREDTSGHAGRLYDHLKTRYGDDVFMDIDAIGPGVEYVKLIDETLTSIEVVLVMIGQHWLDARDSEGRRRLDIPDDLVRLEVAEALAGDVMVIPVLVQDATLPDAEQLPPDLASLARRNAIELSDERWRYDADRLLEALDALLTLKAPNEGQTGEPQPTDEPGAPPRVEQVRAETAADSRSSNRSGLVLASAGAFLVLAFGVLFLPQWHNEQNGLRLIIALVVVALAVTGLVTRRANLVMYAGVAGLVGFAVWFLALLPGHEIAEISSLGTDGVTNLMIFTGSALLVAGGWMARSTTDPAQPGSKPG